MKIAFRVDASRRIGLGHVVRCLSLAEELRTLGAEVLFVARSLDVDMSRVVAGRKFSICTLPATAESRLTGRLEEQNDGGWQNDADETVVALGSVVPIWLSLTTIPSTAVGTVRRRARKGSKSNRRSRGSQLLRYVLVDHNICDNHRDKYFGLVSSRTRILGGPRFALLERPFGRPGATSFTIQCKALGFSWEVQTRPS